MEYIITFNAGYGDNYEIIEADTINEAEKIAYEQWLQEAESQAKYCAEPYSDELASDYGI